jgi:hypothetical protein
MLKPIVRDKPISYSDSTTKNALVMVILKTLSKEY